MPQTLVKLSTNSLIYYSLRSMVLLTKQKYPLMMTTKEKKKGKEKMLIENIKCSRELNNKGKEGSNKKQNFKRERENRRKELEQQEWNEKTKIGKEDKKHKGKNKTEGHNLKKEDKKNQERTMKLVVFGRQSKDKKSNNEDKDKLKIKLNVKNYYVRKEMSKRKK